jgi:hypothetical protein
MIELRVRSKIAKEELDAKVGKILRPSDYNVLLTGPTTVRKPNGDLLCVYLPRAIPQPVTDASWPTLSSIKMPTDNRGLASGSASITKWSRQRTMPVFSAMLGAADPAGGAYPMCRLTAWTAEHVQGWRDIQPFFRAMADVFAEAVPDRHRTQVQWCQRTRPDWVIRGTPYTTITVNNTYATGVHTDKGDLDEGFSCLAVLRRGTYTGGCLTFPEYRVAVDLQDGDMLLMDAHEWHGNTELVKGDAEAERVSVVAYYRTAIAKCDTAEAEAAKAVQLYDARVIR